MEKKYNIYIEPKDIDSIFKNFNNKNPFPYSQEIKKVKKEYNLCDDSKIYEKLGEEIFLELKNLKKNNYLYVSKNNKKIAIIKIRMISHDNNRGKSGGYRIIALVDDKHQIAYILSIYKHSNGKDNISATEKNNLKKLCDEYAIEA